MSKIIVKPVQTAREKRSFINLPWNIYKHDPTWVPPFKLAIKDQLDPKHPFYETAEVQSFLAYKERHVVGRIMAINPIQYNKFHNSKTGFFGFYECTPSKISRELFKAVESWCVDKKLEELRGL